MSTTDNKITIKISEDGWNTILEALERLVNDHLSYVDTDPDAIMEEDMDARRLRDRIVALNDDVEVL